MGGAGKGSGYFCFCKVLEKKGLVRLRFNLRMKRDKKRSIEGLIPKRTEMETLEELCLRMWDGVPKEKVGQELQHCEKHRETSGT